MSEVAVADATVVRGGEDMTDVLVAEDKFVVMRVGEAVEFSAL